MLAELPKLYPALRVACTREVVARRDVPEAERQLVEALITAVEIKHSPCRDAEAERCLTEAEQYLGRLERGSAAVDWRLAPLHARLLTLRGQPGRAAALLIERCQRARSSE